MYWSDEMFKENTAEFMSSSYPITKLMKSWQTDLLQNANHKLQTSSEGTVNYIREIWSYQESLCSLPINYHLSTRISYFK